MSLRAADILTSFLSRREPGALVSLGLHASALVLALYSFSAAKPFMPAQESVPVDVMSEKEFSDMMKGEKTGQKAPEPMRRVDRVAETKADKDPGQAKKDVDAPPPKAAEAAPPKAEPEAVKPPPPPQRMASVVPPPPLRVTPPVKAPAAKPEEDEEDDREAEIIKQKQIKAEQERKLEEARKRDEKLKAEQKAAEDKRKAEAEAKAREDKAREDKAREARAQADAKQKLLEKLEAEEEAKEKAEEAKKLAKAKADAEAKAKADAAAKAKALADAKAKAEAKAKADAESSKLNDAIRNRLLASREAPSSTGSTGAALSRQTSLGAPNATGKKLSPSDRAQLIGMLTEQMNRCISYSGSAPRLGPQITFTLNRDGSIAGGVNLANAGAEPSFRPFAEASMRALRNCQPYRIPARFLDTYDDWKNVRLNIDTSDMQ